MTTLSLTKPVVVPVRGAALALGALVVVYLLAVWTVAGQVIDTRIMNTVASGLREAAWTETLLHVVSPALILCLTAVVALTAGLVRGARSAVASSVVVGGTLIGAEVLKAALIRPAWLDTAGNSLPSGHVAATAALAAAAVLAAPRSARLFVGAVGAVVVLATGVATMAEGWHRPSDVVAAVLVALTVGLMTWTHQGHRSHTGLRASLNPTQQKETS